MTAEDEKLVGQLWATSGIALDAEDGFTRLNPDARAMLKEAASALSRLSTEVQELRAALTIAEERFSQIETAGFSQTRQSTTDILIYARSLAADGSIRARAAIKPETEK